jgi:hypothetical protein
MKRFQVPAGCSSMSVQAQQFDVKEITIERVVDGIQTTQKIGVVDVPDHFGSDLVRAGYVSLGETPKAPPKAPAKPAEEKPGDKAE